MAAKYNLQNVFVNWGPVIMTGLSKDSAVSITYNADFNSVQVSGDGKSNTRSVMNDRSAVIEVSLSQTSITNALLNAQMLLLDAGGISPPLFVEHLDTGATFVAESCWVKKSPDVTFGEEASDWTWTFETDRLISVLGVTTIVENNTP